MVLYDDVVWYISTDKIISSTSFGSNLYDILLATKTRGLISPFEVPSFFRTKIVDEVTCLLRAIETKFGVNTGLGSVTT